MLQITDAEYDNLIRRTAGVLSSFQPGEDAVAVLSRIYRENLPDKSPRQAELMAQELIGLISRFRGGCDAAAADPEGYVRYMLTDILKSHPVDTRCRILQGILGTEQNSADYDALLEQAVAFLSRNTELPPAGEYDLRQRAKFYCGEDMILAATAMMLYTMAKNGELSGFPEDITLAQTALCVCTNDSQCQLLWLEAGGNLTRSELTMLLNAVSLTFKMLWFALVIRTVVTAFTATGAFAVTAGALGTLATVGILTVLVFTEFDQMLALGTDMVTEIPMKLQAMGSMTLQSSQTSQMSADIPARPAIAPQNDDHFLTDEDDDPAYF